MTLQPSRERTLINGCADAVYNRFVIEYKPSNSLRKEPNARPNQHAIAQVKQYLERLERHRRERLAGAVLDGNFFIFVRYRDNHWYIDDPLPVSAHSTETFLCYLLSLSTERAVTPEDLVRDFGENSNTARAVVPALYRALGQTFDVFETSKVSILFRSGFHRQSNHLDREAGQVVMVRDDARRVVEAVCEQMDAKGLEGFTCVCRAAGPTGPARCSRPAFAAPSDQDQSRTQIGFRRLHVVRNKPQYQERVETCSRARHS